MLYIEAGQVLDYARRSLPPTGIQRLTLVCINHLSQILGFENVRLLVFDQKNKTWYSIAARPYVQHNELSAAHFNVRSTLWTKAALNPKDSMLFTEAWWWPVGLADATERLKRESGAHLIRFVHDVIPLVKPEFVGSQLPEQFLKGLRHAATTADLIVTNSKASHKDIVSVLSSLAHTLPPISVVPLAHEFEKTHSIQRKPTLLNRLRRRVRNHKIKKLINHMPQQSHVLCVGTIESRKNILRLLQIWQQLSAHHGVTMPDLILAGRWGWHSDDIRKFLKATRNLNGKVKVLRGFNDDALAALYDSCLFSVYLSYYEGWGLPVGESMWLAKPVLASNSSSIPEVGGKLIDYVDPEDNEAIARNIARLSFNETHRNNCIAALKLAKLRSWDEFAQDLVAAMKLKAVKTG